MKSQFRKAAFWSIAGSGSQQAVVFAVLVYLAHVLTPVDFGLMATVAIGLDLGIRIARWGQVELLQQERYRNDDARNQSLGLSLAIGALFTVAFLVAAEPAGRAYKSDQLTLLMVLCAPVFLLSASSSTAEALLRAQFRFEVIAVRNTVTSLIGSAVAIVLVNFGYGVVALAVQRVVQSVIAAIWIWTALDWRPNLRRIGWSRELAREGTAIMVGTLMPLLVPRTVDFFVGFLLGPLQLGLMRVGSRINEFVGQVVVMPLVSVANTQLSNMSADLAAMRRSFLRMTQASAVMMSPALVGLSLVATEAIPIIFGPQWTGSVPFVQVIGLLGLVAPINYYFAPAMMALGQSDKVLRQGVMQTVLGIALAAAAAQISLVAIAFAMVMRGTAVAVYNLIDLRNHMQLQPATVLRNMAPPYLGTLIMTVAVLGVRQLVGEWSPLATLLLLSATGAAAYGATLIAGGRLGLWPAQTWIGPRRMLRATSGD
ncbi:MAG: hypothetical protein B7Z08_06260 [Sphingomonadales bacterium 32-68-7]|nr:MAG: hypothetical protein B7Z33_08175 [Sphingomonadales bacterium 12-68-11]OYX09204.1 MAG: hypothetical protein B7Z08_06260 [Sphingomonadales bacterium 32-68-7]